MNKIFAALLIFFCSALSLFGQSFSFPGTRMGNYTGVQSVFFNPAQAADSRYKFDLNLFGLNAGLGNNKAAFSLNNVFSPFSSDDALSSLFSGDGLISGQVNVDILGPSLLVSLPKKAGIALTTRLRGQFSITDLDGKLGKSVLNDLGNEVTLPYRIVSNANMRINSNGWAEYGLTFGKVLYEFTDHFFKAGATIKYLSGAGNTYFQLDQLNTTIINDPNPTNANLYLQTGSRGVVGLGVSGGLEALTPSALLNSASNGIGADLGFIYEYRPGFDRKHPYKVRVSLSLLDFGSIKYKRDLSKSGTYAMRVTSVPGFNLQTLQGVSIADYKQFFATNPNFTASPTNNEETISVSLPTTAQAFVDVHLANNFYLSAGTQLSLVNQDKPENPFLYSGFTLTPRYEGKGVGVYVPLNYNSLTKITMGTTLRLGPLYVGSGSILSALLSQSKQADVHVGLRLGILKKVNSKQEDEEKLKEILGVPDIKISN